MLTLSTLESNKPNNKHSNINSELEREDGLWAIKDLELCGPIPPHTPHAVSCSIPEWKNVLQFLEGDPVVTNRLKYGYPRVHIHVFVRQLNTLISSNLKLNEGLACFSFPSSRVAQDCIDFIKCHAETSEQLEAIGSVSKDKHCVSSTQNPSSGKLAVDYVVFDNSLASLVEDFWQYSGEIISSRFAAHCLRISGNTTVEDVIRSEARFYKGNRTPELSNNGVEYEVYLETCLDESHAFEREALYRETIKSRISSGLASGETDNLPTSSDVFLFPSGMSSIYNALRLAHSISEPARSVCFGFSYKDTPGMLGKFGPGCIFYGMGDSKDLIQLGRLLANERISMLICEFPTNPLLKAPDLGALRELADTYGFLLVVDDTLGNFVNLHGLLKADVIVTSLTKIFSGSSDLMAGSLVLSPRSNLYDTLKRRMAEIYEDNVWCEDALVLERNSRSVEARARKINLTSEALADFLKDQPLIKQVHYPKYSTPELYNKHKRREGGYGGLISIEFKHKAHAAAFYDAIPLPKGPSLGTNFTLVVPYVIMAYHKELEAVLGYGIESHQIRVSVGLEGVELLKARFLEALDYASNLRVD